VDIAFSHGILTVSGTRKTELADDDPSNFYVRERFYGQFRRSITLPDATEPQHITATFDDGLVEIVVSGAARSSSHTTIQLKDKSSTATSRTLS
jgi:HSP20 family protein